MNRMNEIFENVRIDSWVKHFLHAPHQINKSHETDAELIANPAFPEHYLAVTIDTIAEEITTGLYQDAYTMGWVTVMASFSDLAAVGADPLGLLVSTSIESCRDEQFVHIIAQGMEEACRTLGVYILGGDVNVTESVSLTGCAVGVVPRKGVITRRGCKAGDALFITGGIGVGNALGFARLAGMPENYFPETSYRPVARLTQGQLARRRASSAMDTSDGLLTTLDQLMRINGVGFVVECDWEKILTPEVYDFCNRTKTPHWLMTAGPHGEFELLFTVASAKEKEAAEEFQRRGVNLIKVGRVQERPAVSLVLPSGREVDVDMAPLRNLLYDVGGDLTRYLKEFRAFGIQWGLE